MLPGVPGGGLGWVPRTVPGVGGEGARARAHHLLRSLLRALLPETANLCYSPPAGGAAWLVSAAAGSSPFPPSHPPQRSAVTRLARVHRRHEGQEVRYQQHSLVREERLGPSELRRALACPCHQSPTWPCGQGRVMATYGPLRPQLMSQGQEGTAESLAGHGEVGGQGWGGEGRQEGADLPCSKLRTELKRGGQEGFVSPRLLVTVLLGLSPVFPGSEPGLAQRLLPLPLTD